MENDYEMSADSSASGDSLDDSSPVRDRPYSPSSSPLVEFIEPKKMCPFCSLRLKNRLARHLFMNHSDELADPPRESAKAIAEIAVTQKNMGYRLVTTESIREIVGDSMWKHREHRACLYRLLTSLQVRLWSGNWMLKEAGLPHDYMAKFRKFKLEPMSSPSPSDSSYNE